MVDGQPTPDLDAFIEAIRERTDRESVRLKTIDLDGRTSVTTLKLDLEYWPTTQLRLTPEGWRVQSVPASDQVLDHQGGDPEEGKKAESVGEESNKHS